MSNFNNIIDPLTREKMVKEHMRDSALNLLMDFFGPDVIDNGCCLFLNLDKSGNLTLLECNHSFCDALDFSFDD